MPISIKSNISSLDAQRSLAANESERTKTLGKLSSAWRINSAQDDAAGLAISVQLLSELASYNRALHNAGEALNVVETADVALDGSAEIVGRLRELAAQSASAGVSDVERGYIQDEASGLMEELGRIANATEYNGTRLLDGGGAMTFQVGVDASPSSQIAITPGNATTSALGLTSLNLATADGARSSLGALDSALQSLSATRATLGAQANRVNAALDGIAQSVISLAAANSRIRDADIAAEASNLASQSILGQASVSVLAQANQRPQYALKLIGT